MSLLVLVAVLILALAYYQLRGRESSLNHKLKQISSEYQRHLVIPDGLDGYIELDYLLLNSHGLVVLDYRDIRGTLFPGANLELWSVLQDGQRFSIQNPFVNMRNRLNAVRALVRDVPVCGVVVFPDTVEFGNQPPENVIRETDLLELFADTDSANKESMIKAFHHQYKHLTSLIPVNK